MNKIGGKAWSVIIVLLLVSVGLALAYFVHRTTTDISDALAAEVLEQQSDVALLLHNYDALKLTFERERLSKPGDITSAQIETALQKIESQLEAMRFNYSFERLDGAATAHAYVKPVLEDIRHWIDNGIPGIEASSEQLVSVASQRLFERYDALRAIGSETYIVASELVTTQTGYLNRFGNSLMFLLAAFALLAIGIAGLLTRQRDLQTQLAIDQQQHSKRIKDFADTGADWFWEIDSDMRLRILSGETLATSTAHSTPATHPISATQATTTVPANNRPATDYDDQLPPFDRDIVDGHWPMQLLSNHEEFSDFESEQMNQDGTVSTISLSGRPLFDEQGSFRGYRGIGRDISGRKQMEADLERANLSLIRAETSSRYQAEQALRDSEIFLRTSLNALPQCLAILNKEGVVLEVNTAWKVDASPNQTPGAGGIGRNYKEVFFNILADDAAVSDASAKIDWVLDGSADSLNTQVQVKQLDKNDWYSIALSPFESNSNRYGVLALEKVTDRIVLEQQDRQLRAELAHFARLTTVGELATGLAHELNQPLTAITHNCDALLSGLGNTSSIDKDDLDAINEIHAEADRAGAIIRGLRKLVRKETAVVMPTDINQLVAETMRLSMPDATRYGIDIKLDLAENLPLPEIDSVQIQQVLVNLERNGVEAIRMGDPDVRQMIISTMEDQSGVRVTVQDSGGGFDENVRENLFSPFLTTKKGGMGMGLSISRSIIESHGGQLWVDFSDPVMTTFCFTLPVPIQTVHN